ncbi:MAG: hypothetical protein J5859_03610 [Clostridia bacterium]|nr:hypothetical protein [Clostridia bacterium]
MKKLFSVILTLALLTVCVTPAFAAGKLETVSDVLYVTEGYSSVYCYAYGEVENTGDKTVYYKDGLVEVFDEDEEVLKSYDWLSCYPECLEPGEKAFLIGSFSLDSGVSKDAVADYDITPSKASSGDNCHRLPAEITYKIVKETYSTYEYLIATVTNDTSSTIYNAVITMALKDADGNVVWASGNSVYNIGIPGGQTIEYRNQINYDTVIQYLREQQGVDISTLTPEVIAYFETK